MKHLAKVLQITVIALLTIILVCNLYTIAARELFKVENPTVFGYSWAVVISGSMEPTVGLDDLVISRRQESYSVGDIITFTSGSSLTTHRIVGESDSGFVTRGDANNTEDREPVKSEQIVGRVICTIPRVGLIISYLRSPIGMAAVVLIGLLLLQIPYYAAKLRRKKEQGGN